MFRATMQCLICYKSMLSLNHLQHHVRLKHNNNASKNFTCHQDKCLRIYGSLKSLYQHIRRSHVPVVKRNVLCSSNLATIEDSSTIDDVNDLDRCSDTKEAKNCTESNGSVDCTQTSSKYAPDPSKAELAFILKLYAFC